LQLTRAAETRRVHHQQDIELACHGIRPHPQKPRTVAHCRAANALVLIALGNLPALTLCVLEAHAHLVRDRTLILAVGAEAAVDDGFHLCFLGKCFSAWEARSCARFSSGCSRAAASTARSTRVSSRCPAQRNICSARCLRLRDATSASRCV